MLVVIPVQQFSKCASPTPGSPRGVTKVNTTFIVIVRHYLILCTSAPMVQNYSRWNFKCWLRSCKSWPWQENTHLVVTVFTAMHLQKENKRSSFHLTILDGAAFFILYLMKRNTDIKLSYCISKQKDRTRKSPWAIRS